ncbi:MAG: antibiotic biosynthesis monooxygenase family protein [Pseudonocardiaceae bacterium]
MSGQIRVLVYQVAEDPAAVHHAYHKVSRRMRSVPGLIGNELLGSVLDPTGFVVVSRWTDATAFWTWEQGVEHRDTTAPLRPYRDARRDAGFGIYQVLADY